MEERARWGGEGGVMHPKDRVRHRHTRREHDRPALRDDAAAGIAHGRQRDGDGRARAEGDRDLGFGRIVVSVIEAPRLLVALVRR
jgi:hypothetical protein